MIPTKLIAAVAHPAAVPGFRAKLACKASCGYNTAGDLPTRDPWPMHEMSAAAGIIKVLRAKLKEFGPCKLTALEVSVGELSSIEPDSLRLALDTMLAEQGYHGVEIRFQTAPAEFECYACTWKGREEKFTAICPLCGQGAVFIVGGRDVTLENIEVE